LNLRAESGAPGAEIKPVVASGTAVFAPDSKIIADSINNATGRFPILKAPAIYIDAPDINAPDFLDAPGNFSWKLQLVDEPDDSQTLYLSCFKQGTLFLVR